ncbi:MAG: hypothetical protein V7L13_03605 [Nostoc sp.]
MYYSYFRYFTFFDLEIIAIAWVGCLVRSQVPLYSTLGIAYFNFYLL